MSRLTLIAATSSKARQTDNDSVWSELLQNLFCFVFPNNSHLKRDTLFSLSEWVSFPLHFPFVQTAATGWLVLWMQRADRWILSTKLCTALFIPPQIPDHILEQNHLLSCYASPSLSFHFQINKIFISRICTQTTLNLCKNNYSQKPELPRRDTFDCTAMDTKERFKVPHHHLLNTALHSFTFCTWSVPASHFYFISLDS